MTENDIRDINQVVEEEYICGIHGEQSRNLMDEGFHPAFEMLVLDKGEVTRVSVDEW
jgi:hypothetical protein